MPSYTVIQNLPKEIEIPRDGTLTHTLHKDNQVKVVLLGLAGGQELARHMATTPATIQVIQGEARVTLDGEEKELSGGSWVFLEANLPHAIYARTDVFLLLTMLPG